MKNKDDEAVASCVGCLYSLALSPLAAFLNAFALKTLWDWFMVQAGMPAITYYTAYGITAIVQFLTIKSEVPTEEERSRSTSDRLIQSTLWLFLKPGVALLFGWIVWKLFGQ